MTPGISLVIGQLSWGGAERQLSVLARGLAARGEAVDVICLSQLLNPFGDQLLAAGIEVQALERRHRREGTRVLELARLLRRRKTRLIHSFLDNSAIYTWLAAKLTRGRLRLLPSIRSVPIAGDPLRQVLLRRSLLACPLIITNSRAAAEGYAERYGLPLERFRVVYNGVVLPELAGAEERLRCRQGFGLTEDSRPVLGAVSKDAPFKNFPAYLRLVDRLEREAGPLCSLAAGRGLDESYPVRLMPGPRRSLCQTRFLGPRNEMDSFYRSLDLLVLTSLRESLPNVLLEAMSHGVPCVAYAVAGIPEIITDGVDGCLVAPNDEEELFRVVRALLADPARRAALGAAARATVARRFGVETMLDSTCRVYEELLES